MSDNLEQMNPEYMTKEQYIQRELRQFEADLRSVEQDRGLFEARNGKIERNVKKYGKKFGKKLGGIAVSAIKHPIRTIKLVRGAYKVGQKVSQTVTDVRERTLETLDIISEVGTDVARELIPTNIQERITTTVSAVQETVTTATAAVNSVVNSVNEVISPYTDRAEEFIKESAKKIAIQAGESGFDLLCEIKKAKMRRILEYSLNVAQDSDARYLDDLDAHVLGVSIVNNKSLDAVDEKQRKALARLNRESFLKLNSSRRTLGLPFESGQVTNFDYLKEVPSFIIPRQEGFWGKLNIVDYFRHKNSEKKARESMDAQPGTLESRVLGFKALDLSQKEVDIFAPGMLAFFLGRATKGGKAQAEHKKLVAQVERNRLVYQQEQLESYTKLHSRLSDRSDLRNASSADVSKAFKQVLLEEKDGSQTLAVTKDSIFYKEQNVTSADRHNNAATKGFMDMFSLLERLKGGMSAAATNPALADCMREYQADCSQLMTDGSEPLYQNYFRTKRSVRILSSMPQYAEVLLMACISQRLFDTVNHYGFGKDTIDMTQFGKLAANYRLSRLAADAIVNRRDFIEAFREGEQIAIANERAWIDRISDAMIAKAGPEYAEYISQLKTESTRNDGAMGPIVDSMIELGAANAQLTDEMLDSFYAEKIQPLVLSMPSKEAIIRDYIRNYRQADTLGIKAAEDLLAAKMKEKLGAGLLFGTQWQSLLELNALAADNDRKPEYLPAVKRSLDNFYSEDDQAKLIATNYRTRAQLLVQSGEGSDAGVLARLERCGLNLTVAMLMADEKYAGKLTGATDEEFEQFHRQLKVQAEANIDAVHSVMDMTNVVMRINERKVIKAIGPLMLSGSREEIRNLAEQEFKKLIKSDNAAPAVGSFMKANLIAVLRDNEVFQPYQAKLLTKFLAEYEKDETKLRGISQADLKILFAAWAQGFEQAEQEGAVTLPNSLQFERDLAEAADIGGYLNGMLSLPEAMELLSGAEGFEYLSDLHGDTEHLNIEEYSKLRDTVISRVREFINMLREQEINENWLSAAMQYRCIKAAVRGMDYSQGVIGALDIIQQELVKSNEIALKRENIDPAVYDNNLNILDGIVAGRIPVSVKIFQPVLLKDDSFIEAMSEGGELLNEYANYFVEAYSTLFAAIQSANDGETAYDEDILALYLNVNAERLANSDTAPATAEEWDSELKAFHRELGQKVIGGESFDSLMKESDEDRDYKPGEKIAILSMLLAAGKVKYTELYEVERAKEILGHFREMKHVNSDAVKKNVADTELENAFRQRYALAILTEEKTEFEGRLSERLEECRGLLEEAKEREKLKQQEAEEEQADTLLAEEVRREVENGILAGKRAYSSHFCIIEGGRISYFREQSPLAVSYGQVQEKTTEELNEEQRKAFEGLQKELKEKLQDSAKTSMETYKLRAEYTPDEAVKPEELSAEEIEAKAKRIAETAEKSELLSRLFGELSSLEVANGGGWFTAGNYEAVLLRLNDVCTEASAMLRRKFDARIEKAVTAEEKAKLQKLYHEELYRFMVYLIAQKKLDLPRNEYKKSMLGKTAKIAGAVVGGVGAVAKGVWNFLTWSSTDYSVSDVTKRMEAEHDEFHMVQAEVNLLEQQKLRLTDMDLQAKLSDEIQAVQLEMFTMPQDKFKKFIRQRIHFYEMAQQVKDTVNELVAAEYANSDKELQDIYSRCIGNNMLYFMQTKIRSLMPNIDSVQNEATLSANKQVISQSIRDLLTGEKKEYYYKAFNTEMTRTAVNSEVLEERATIVGDVGMKAAVENMKGLGEECMARFESLSMPEKKALLLAVTLPIRFTGYDMAGSLSAVKSGVYVTERNTWESLDDHVVVTQKEVYRIIDLLKNDSTLEGQTYSDADIRLWAGYTPESLARAQQIFNQCYSIVISCRNLLEVYEKKDWKQQPDNADTIMLARRLGRSEGLPAEVKTREQFVERVKAELGEDSGLVKRLEECENFPMLITALQNRSMLDRSTNASESYANEILRKKIAERFTQKEQAQKRSQDVRNSLKTVYMTQGLYALYSYQKRDEYLVKTGTLSERDLAKGALERSTALDTELLASALDYVETIEANRAALEEDFAKTYAEKLSGGQSGSVIELSEDANTIMGMIQTQISSSGDDDFTVYVDRTRSIVGRMVSDFNQEQLRAARNTAGV